MACDRNDIFIQSGYQNKDTLVIGAPASINSGSLPSYIAMALGGMPHGNWKQIEFVPFFSRSAEQVSTYDEWLTREHRDDNVEGRIAFYRETPSTTLDLSWSTLQSGDDVETVALVFATNQSLHVPTEDVSTALALTPNILTTLTHLLENRHGKGNVFVSSQVVLMQTFIDQWKDFHTQGVDRLTQNQRYCRHVYDTQTAPAGQLYNGCYCIPVSIRHYWKRHVYVEEFSQYVESMETSLMAKEEMSALFRGIHPLAEALGHGFYTLGGCCHINHQLDTVYQSIAGESSDQPRSQTSFWSRFMHRAKPLN